MDTMLRPATPDDLPAITRFDAFLGDRAREIGDGHCIVAEAGGQAVAYASWVPAGLLGQPFLAYLCVDPAWRRRGMATALVGAVQARATGRMLLSSTEDWCTDTQRIFERLGWRRVGEIAGVNRDGSAEWFYAIDLA